MKNIVKIFALVVAISAVVIFAFQVVDFVHMMVAMTNFESEGSKSSLVFDPEGFEAWFPFIS
jgi:hypothetical protein